MHRPRITIHTPHPALKLRREKSAPNTPPNNDNKSNTCDRASPHLHSTCPDFLDSLYSLLQRLRPSQCVSLHSTDPTTQNSKLHPPMPIPHSNRQLLPPNRQIKQLHRMPQRYHLPLLFEMLENLQRAARIGRNNQLCACIS